MYILCSASVGRIFISWIIRRHSDSKKTMKLSSYFLNASPTLHLPPTLILAQNYRIIFCINQLSLPISFCLQNVFAHKTIWGITVSLLQPHFPFCYHRFPNYLHQPLLPSRDVRGKLDSKQRKFPFETYFKLLIIHRLHMTIAAVAEATRTLHQNQSLY